VKGKAILVQALRVPGGWRSQNSRQSAHESNKFVSPKNRPPLLLRKYSWYSFLSEAGSITGSQCGRKNYIDDKLQWHLRNRTRDLPVCSAMSQPTALPLDDGQLGRNTKNWRQILQSCIHSNACFVFKYYNTMRWIRMNWIKQELHLLKCTNYW
jgi:hypothetical protein